MKNKSDWNQEIYRLLPEEQRKFSDKIPINLQFWHNPDKNNGFRLTSIAWDLMSKSGYKFNEHIIDIKKL